MKILRFLLFTLFSLAAHADGPYVLPWERVTELWITPSQARLYGPGAVQSLIGIPPPTVGCQVPGTWCVADLKPWGVPADAKYAFLTGLLLITHGTNSQQAALQLTFRKPGDVTADCSKYLGQVIEPFIGGGERSGMATWVALVNGTVEYCFQYEPPTGWPDWAAYGLNLSVQAWAR